MHYDTTFRGWLVKNRIIPGFDPHPNGAEGRHDHLSGADRAAAVEMCKHGTGTLPVLFEVLKNDDGSAVYMSIVVCGRLKDPVAVQPLLDRLRFSAARRKWLRDSSSRPSMMTPADSGAIDLIMDALVKIGSKGYVPLLKAAKEYDLEDRGRIPEKMGEEWGSDIVPELVAMLSDPDCLYAAGAARALGDMKAMRAIPELLKMYENKDADNNVRICAAGALARMGREDVLSFLLQMTKSPDAESRVAVASALGTDEIKGTFAPLISLLDDKSISVRTTAAFALAELGDPRAIPAIERLYNDSDLWVRSCATVALENLRQKSSGTTKP